ncbi:6187_t:CDS:2 [Ambispora gerdemannii]|uniref:6187_t:CDS:1 n=1 Tax=Ambispora gerdemannii TaxID=144530 RepID=A0A9N9BHN9_9GLOM|nr:6187_t:CDS:2 [Ambispora gerdemannii]
MYKTDDEERTSGEPDARKRHKAKAMLGSDHTTNSYFAAIRSCIRLFVIREKRITNSLRIRGSWQQKDFGQVIKDVDEFTRTITSNDPLHLQHKDSTTHPPLQQKEP